MDTVVSVFAAIGAILFAIWTVWYNRKQALNQSLANLAYVISLERSIAEIPTVFRFHGISGKQIADADLKPDELAYLVASITAGGVYHRTHTMKTTGAFPIGSYRHTMCSTPDFRKAWPLIKKMMNESDYTKRIEATIVK